jgi:hypothetical integral membrane protein (TIGR02206 family)
MFESFYVNNTRFSAWNTEHWVWLIYGIVSTVFWVYLGTKAKSDEHRRKIALYMTSVGVVTWVVAVAIMIGTGQAKTQSVLPFHLCYFLNLLFPLVFWKRWMHILDWVYPIVMAGCLQALFTPDLSQAFPHYYNFRYWFVHIGLIHAILFAVFIYRFRPTIKGVFKCFVALNAYALVVTPVNLIFNTNFLYLREPAPGSIMELFGPWPNYLFVIEGLMLVMFLFVYLPFVVPEIYRRIYRFTGK